MRIVFIFIEPRLKFMHIDARDLEDEYASAWVDFDPKIANCFTDDLNACNHLLSRMSKNGWQCLQQGLNQLEDIENEGLYYIELEKDLVRNAY